MMKLIDHSGSLVLEKWNLPFPGKVKHKNLIIHRFIGYEKKFWIITFIERVILSRESNKGNTLGIYL